MKSSVQDEKFSKIKSKCCALKKNIFAIMDYQHNELIQGHKHCYFMIYTRGDPELRILLL